MSARESGATRVSALVFLCAVAAFAVASVAVWRAKTADTVSAAWILGPPAPVLDARAREELARGLATLNDATLPADERLRAWEASLERAEASLECSLRARPIGRVRRTEAQRRLMRAAA